MEVREQPITPCHGKLHTLRAFRHKNFSLFFSGQTISLVGTWSQSLAISWLVWKMTNSSVWLGVIGFMIQFPMLILGLAGGVYADRHDRLRSLTILQVLCMLQAIILAALTIYGKIELWHIFLLSAMLGTIYAFEFPVRQAFVMDIVGKRDLLNAVSLNAAMLHATRMVGPMFAGLIVAWKGEGICFLINAATFLALISTLLLIDKGEMIHFEKNNQEIVPAIKTAFRHLWSDGHLIFATALMGIVALFDMPFVYLMPIFADDVFHGGAVQLGWLMAASAAGSLTGALLLANRKSTEKLLSLAVLSLIGSSLALIVFSRITDIWFAMAVAAVSSLFLTMAISTSITILQHRTPDELRGRMSSFFTMAFMGLAPFGSLLGGFLAKYIGAQHTITVCGIIGFIISCLILIRARRLDRIK